MAKFLQIVVIIALITILYGIEDTLGKRPKKKKEPEGSAEVPAEEKHDVDRFLVIPRTNLVTGVYYRLMYGAGNRFAVVTWTDLPLDGDYKYVQMDDHDRQPKYVHGGEWYESALWIFKASEIPGYVTIHNGKDCKNILAMLDEKTSPEHEAPEDEYAIMVAESDGHHGVGHEKRNLALWEITQCSVQADNYYLRNYGLKRLVHVTTRFGHFYRYLSSPDDKCHSPISALFRIRAVTTNLTHINPFNTYNP